MNKPNPPADFLDVTALACGLIFGVTSVGGFALAMATGGGNGFAMAWGAMFLFPVALVSPLWFKLCAAALRFSGRLTGRKRLVGATLAWALAGAGALALFLFIRAAALPLFLNRPVPSTLW